MTTIALALGLVFIAAGAILIWAVDDSVAGIDLSVAGWIAVAVGTVGLLLALVARVREPTDGRRVHEYTTGR